MNHEEHMRVHEQKQNNDYIKRRSVYGQLDNIETIEGQY